MDLSNYCDEKETEWNNIEENNANKIIEYINSKIDKNLYELAKTNNNTEVYKKLRIWLLDYYKKELYDGLSIINITKEDFYKSIIYSLILSITRKTPNLEFLINVYKKNNIIKDLIEYEDGKYKLIINDSKKIYFEASDKYYQEDINKFEDRIIDSCHEVSLYMIKKYKEYTAVTSICTKELNKKFYHSFILNKNTIIDLTANLIMDKDTYYELNKVQELNKLNYQEYLNEKDKSIEFDKNNELFELLRMALFKQNKK